MSDFVEKRSTDRYRGSSGNDYHETLHSVNPRAWEQISLARAKKIQPHVKASDRVAEFGIGPGWNVAALTCASRIGVDVSTFYAADLLARGIEFAESTDAVDDRSVDVVLCHHMLEHVAKPSVVLGEAHRTLVQGGRLLLYVPYESQRKYRRFDPEELNHHLYSWNAQTLAALVTDAGFVVQTAKTQLFGYDRFVAQFVASVRLPRRAARVIWHLLHLIRPIREVCVVASAGIESHKSG
jgi:SAM-dependent methyltransferase